MLGLLAVAALILLVPAAAAKAPPRDHGFPLDEYLRGLVAGKVFVGGSPPKILGAKTKDAVSVRDGRAHFQPQLALRRAGRDDGQGRFLVLKARSWGSAAAYVIQLDPGIVKLFRIAFPKAIGGKPFPPLYAGITYTFEVAPDSPNPAFTTVGVAGAPHPDPKLRKAGVTLVTFKKGLTPGNYIVRVTAAVGLKPHPLRSLYEAYENVTGVAEWVSIALAPGEVALEKLVDTAIEKLVEAAAQGDPKAAAALSTQALREKVAKKALENAVRTALTETEVVAKIAVPTVVPDLSNLRRADALAKLQERFLRYTWLAEPTRSSKLIGHVKSQSLKPGTKVKVGTGVRVRVYVLDRTAPKPTTTATVPGGSLSWVLDDDFPNPAHAAQPPGVRATPSRNHIDYDILTAPQTEFDIDIDTGVPPARVKPGAPYAFAVRIRGKLTGDKSTQGFRVATAILLVNGRWVGTFAETGQNCNDPIGSDPITCTQPTDVNGTAKLTFPGIAKAGDTFNFGVGLLNCTACYVEYRYTAR